MSTEQRETTVPETVRAAILQEAAEDLLAEARRLRSEGAPATTVVEWRHAAERVRRMTTEPQRSPAERAVEAAEALAYFWETHDDLPYARSLRAALAAPSTSPAGQRRIAEQDSREPDASPELSEIASHVTSARADQLDLFGAAS